MPLKQEQRVKARSWLRLVGVISSLALLSGCVVAEGGFRQEIYLQPGESIQLHNGVAGCCYFILPVPVPSIWFTSPTESASMNFLTGTLTIDEGAEDGTSFMVSSLAGSSATVYVYDPARNPLLGSWSELYELRCEGMEEVEPVLAIEEVIFFPHGIFSVTWYPFELYKDYWGTYTFDPAAGTLTMEIDFANYEPDGLDLSGRFTVIEDGVVELQDMWLGTDPSYSYGEDEVEVSPPGCGHQLVRNLDISEVYY